MNNEIAKLRDEKSEFEDKLSYWKSYQRYEAPNWISKWGAQIRIDNLESKINKLNKKIDDIIGCC
jgi:hypothetical protein